MRNLRIVSWILLCLWCNSLALVAQSALEVHLDKDIISFKPTLATEGFRLKVRGPNGFYADRSFQALEVPFIEVKNRNGSVLQNGAYAYEILVFGKKGAVIKPIQGSFRVVDGAFATLSDAQSEADLAGKGVYAWENGSIGLGVSVPDPDAQLHIRSEKNPTIRLEKQSGDKNAVYRWDLKAAPKMFELEHQLNGNGQTPLSVAAAPDNSLVIDENGSVGMGTSDPKSKLEVTSKVDQDMVRIHNASNRNKRRNVLTLENYGEVAFQMVMQPSGDIWSFLVRKNDFLISRNGSRAEELRITEDGTLYTSGSINPKSDAAAKKDFEDVAPEEVLQALSKMPISSWSYRSDQTNARHIGPTAQDFNATFNLGKKDGSISVVDSNGVALVAIQALQSRLQQKAEALEQVKQENAQLKSRLTQLEEKVNMLLQKAP